MTTDFDAKNTPRLVRYRNKTYLRIPGGEVQFGHISRHLTVWWRGRRRWPR